MSDNTREFNIKGTRIKFTDNEPIKEGEPEAYIDFAYQQLVDKSIRIAELKIEREGDYAYLNYVIQHEPFQRIRRITGYLSPVDNWNNAKYAEGQDRVKHSLGMEDEHVYSGLLSED